LVHRTGAWLRPTASLLRADSESVAWADSTGRVSRNTSGEQAPRFESGSVLDAGEMARPTRGQPRRRRARRLCFWCKPATDKRAGSINRRTPRLDAAASLQRIQGASAAPRGPSRAVQIPIACQVLTISGSSTIQSESASEGRADHLPWTSSRRTARRLLGSCCRLGLQRKLQPARRPPVGRRADRRAAFVGSAEA
jgi:hypothetical protein